MSRNDDKYEKNEKSYAKFNLVISIINVIILCATMFATIYIGHAAAKISKQSNIRNQYTEPFSYVYDAENLTYRDHNGKIDKSKLTVNYDIKTGFIDKAMLLSEVSLDNNKKDIKIGRVDTYPFSSMNYKAEKIDLNQTFLSFSFLKSGLVEGKKNIAFVLNYGIDGSKHLDMLIFEESSDNGTGWTYHPMYDFDRIREDVFNNKEDKELFKQYNLIYEKLKNKYILD